MKLTIETEEDNEIILAAIACIMEKGEERISPNEYKFLGFAVPIVQAWEHEFYGVAKFLEEGSTKK